MSINKLPTIEHYRLLVNWWFVGNHGIRDIVTRSRVRDTWRKLHFSDNQTADENESASKVRSSIDHFNIFFSRKIAYSEA